jgi:hypothetical protein
MPIAPPEGFVLDNAIPQPPNGFELDSPETSTTTFGSFAGSAVRNVGPTAAFMAAAPTGASVGAEAGAFAGPLGSFVGGGLGALVAGSVAAWGAHKAQSAIADTVAPNSIFSSKVEQQQETEHPLASELGAMATIGKPNPMNIVRAAKTLASDEGRQALATLVAKGPEALVDKPQLLNQVQNVVNVAQGGGINAVFNAYDQIKSGNYSFSDLAKSAAEGTLFNSPWIHAAHPETPLAETPVPPGFVPDNLLPDATTAEADQRTATPEQPATPAAQATEPAPASTSFTAPAHEVVEAAAPEPEAESSPVVRTPDGQVDLVQTALNKLRTEAQPVVAPEERAAMEQTPASQADVVDLAAQLKGLEAAMRDNQLKPSESQPQTPANEEPSQPAAGTATPPAPVVLKPFEAGDFVEFKNPIAGTNHPIKRGWISGIYEAPLSFSNGTFKYAEITGEDGGGIQVPLESLTHAEEKPLTPKVNEIGKVGTAGVLESRNTQAAPVASKIAAQIQDLRDKGQRASAKAGKTGGMKGNAISASSNDYFQQANDLENKNWLILHPEDATPENIANAKLKGFPIPDISQSEVEAAKAPVQPVSSEVAPEQPKVRKSFYIRPRSDGIHDILDEIQLQGGLKSPATTDVGGEYDGYKEAMTGPAALLRRRNGGLRPDDMVEAVKDNFPRIQSADDLYEAVRDAVAQRDKLKETGGGHEAQTQRFWDAVSQPENAKGVEKINVDQLNVGQKFRLKLAGWSHDEMTVTHVDADTGEVTVKDGPTFGQQDLPQGAEIYIRKGTLVDPNVRHAAGDFSFDQPESVADQKARLAEEKRRADEAKAKQAMLDRSQRRLTGDDLDTTQEMFGGRENAASRMDKSGQQSMFAAGELAGQKLREGSESNREAEAHQAQSDLPHSSRKALRSGRRQPARETGQAHSDLASALLADADSVLPSLKNAEAIKPFQGVDSVYNTGTKKLARAHNGNLAYLDQYRQTLLRAHDAVKSADPQAALQAIVDNHNREQADYDRNYPHTKNKNADAIQQGYERRLQGSADAIQQIAARLDEHNARQQNPQQGFQFAAGSKRGLDIQPVIDAINKALGTDKLPSGIRVVRDESAPWGARIEGRNKITVNAAQISTPERAQAVILEEGLHGVWNDPAVQSAWQSIRSLVTPEEMRAEYEKRKAQGLPTDADTIREEAAISHLLNAKPGVLARLWEAIRGAFKRTFGFDLHATASAQLREAAVDFLRGRRESLPGKRIVADNAVITAPGVSPAYAISAYHGTPHEVDRFTTDKIGTGEGAQVYGWGLYFAENPKVAEDYRKNLTEREFINKVRDLYDEFTSTDEAQAAINDPNNHFSEGQKKLLEALKKEDWLGFDYPHQAVSAAVRDGNNVLADAPLTRKALATFGNKYSVQLNVRPEEMLDWDKPLSEQSDNVKTAISGQRFYSSRIPDVNKATGEQIYQAMLDNGFLGTPKRVSERLASIGIKGIRYLDQFSRAKGDVWKAIHPQGGEVFGSEKQIRDFVAKNQEYRIAAPETTYNYVIFNGDDIKITGKNGEPIPTEQAMMQPKFAAGDYPPEDTGETPEEKRIRDAKERSNINAIIDNLQRNKKKPVSFEPKATPRPTGKNIDVETSSRPLAEVWQDFQDAKAALANATHRDEKTQTLSDFQQAAAVAGARYHTVRDELKLHPERIAEVLKEAQRLSAAAKAARDAGNPDLARELESQLDQHRDDLDLLPPKLVQRIQNELIAKGELPKMQEIQKPNAGRTLQAMTDALNKSVSDSPKIPFTERFNVAKQIADKLTAGKDAATRAWGNSVAASKALWSVFKSAPLPEQFKDVMKSWIGYDTRTAIENARYVKALTDKVPQKVRRMAISVWLDAGGDESLLKFQRDSVPDKYQQVWDAALKLTDGEKKIAQDIKANFAAKLDDGMNVGIIGQGREDYGVPQRWKVAPQTEASDISGEKQGKPGNPYAKLDPRDPFFSFQRNTKSYFDGIMAKGEPENLDIAHLVNVYDEAFHKSLSSRGAIKALSEANARDGQPIVKISGKADVRTGDKPGVFVDSKSLPKDAVTADGRPYVGVDHWALRDWKFAAKDNQGRPILVRGDMLVHPDHADFLKNELHTPRWTTSQAQGIEKVGRFGLQASSYLKASKFIGPFHVVTEALHASFHGVVPTVKDFEINLDDPKQALLSRNMMIDMGRAREMYDDGIRSQGGGIWKHVPGLGDAIVRMNNFTFNEYIPKLKMKVGLVVLDRNMARYGGKLTEDQIAEITGRQMDAAFGGQNWRLMGANKSVLAVTRLGLVAPDFLISRAKVIGQVFRPYNNEQRIFLAAQAVGVFALCRVFNAIFSDDHDPHFEPRNWDSVVIGKRAYHARFIVSDAANLARDLLGLGGFNQHGIPFITGRLGVLPKMAAEVGTGKDLFTGQNKDGLFETDNPILKAFSIVAKDTAEWMTPMGVDGFLPSAAAKGVTGPGQALTALVGVSSKKESPANEIWDAARQFNLTSKDPKAVAFQKQRDNDSGTPSDYRALNNLLDAGQLNKAKQEVQRLQNQGKSTSQILSHYERQTYFTGNSQRETAFYASLSPAQQKQYKAAKAEQRERAAALVKAMALK